MDSAADSLLALSNTAVALAAASDVEDDDRSSSLSELDDDGSDNLADEQLATDPVQEADSEAETERLEESPDKLPRNKLFGNTPSKLAQSIQADQRPEIESLTDDENSSISGSTTDSDDLSDIPANDDEPAEKTFGLRSPIKRKREDNEEPDDQEKDRSRRRRTGSIASDEAKSDESEDDEPTPPSREATVEPEAGLDAAEEVGEDEEDKIEHDEEAATEMLQEGRRQKARPSRRRGKDEAPAETDLAMQDDPDAAEASDEAEVDDAEANAKTEEEQARKMAAMEALIGLERHFAALRDRLYDERISAIDQELAQLARPTPTHPELVKQLDIVKKYRDDKFEVEQRLLVFKIGALKNKSVADRSAIHSEYFQTVRDMREQHLYDLSKHFYRIQRDRFKTDQKSDEYIVPFPTKRSKQITQQTAYNKEVSITSGVAKYVGFPAAPSMTEVRSKDLEEDLQKMGVSNVEIDRSYPVDVPQISSQAVRSAQPGPRIATEYSAALAGAAAEEQFLEKNPWANAQHPSHRIPSLSRQNSNRSPMNESYLTPAQQRIVEQPQLGNSASTIPEHPSAQASSVLNTPFESSSGRAKLEVQSTVNRPNSVSPLDTRRAPLPFDEQRYIAQPSRPDVQMHGTGSPMIPRAALNESPSRALLGLVDEIGQHPHSSPSQRPQGIAAGGGFAGGDRLGLY